MYAAPAADVAAESYQFITSNPIKSCLFDWLPRQLLCRKDIPQALKLILMVLHGSLGKDCRLFYRIETLAERTGQSTATVKRAIAKGRELRLFVTMETGRGLKFRLIDQANKVSHQIDHIDPSPITDENKFSKERKNQPPPNRPIKQPPAPTDSQKEPNQPSVALFSENQIEKMGSHAAEIINHCITLKRIQEEGPISFNPTQAVGKSISEGKQPGAICETLKGIAKNWDSIKKPWGIFEAQLKIKNQNWNESREISQSNGHKEALKKLSNIISMEKFKNVF